MRTDIHKPSSIVPEDYAFVAFDYIKIQGLDDCYALKAQREIKAAHFAKTGGTYSTHEHGGVCMVCGNTNAVYTVTFHNSKSNEYIRTGQDCAEKLEMSMGDFNQFHKSMTNHLEAQAGKKKAQTILTAAGFLAAWEMYSVTVPALYAANQAHFDQ